MRKRRDNDRGATIVEAAISYGLLLLALFAVFEFGLAFKDWLSVSNASRTGARAGATFGDDPNTDILVLREVEGTLSPIGLKPGDKVTIYRANNPGPSETYQYAPGNLSDCGTASTWMGTPNPLPDCCDWIPCPEVGRDDYAIPGWDPATRVITAPITDRIGVEIEFTHAWVTGFFGATTDFTTSTEFQIEPQLFAPP